MTLEIQVQDSVYVFDSVGEVESFIRKTVQEWVENSNDSEPLVIVLKKNVTRAPPALGISVTDGINIKEALG